MYCRFSVVYCSSVFVNRSVGFLFFFFFQAEDGIRDKLVTGVQTCALPISPDGTCVRDYVHVADLADAHVGALRFLEERGSSDRFNLGTGRGASVKNVLEAARRVTGRRIAADVVSRRPGDPPQLVADPTRAVETLGWRPKYPELEVQIEHAWALNNKWT